MNPPPKCFTIGISGISGSGKTSLITELHRLLPQSITLHFDHYKSNYDQLTKDLITLRSGKSIHYPNQKLEIHPAKYILVEEPKGKSREFMRDNIDFLVFLDVPLEICLARVLLRSIYSSTDAEINNFYEQIGPQFHTDRKEQSNNSKLMHINVWLLEEYLKSHRQEYIQDRIRNIKEANLVVYGTRDFKLIAQEIIQNITKWNN